MADLDALLVSAKTASPPERIQFRDPIAAHGTDAIATMTDWLSDARLGGFPQCAC